MQPRTPSQVNRNSIVIVVSFFLYVIVASLLLMNIDNGQLASKPVWESVLGKNFVVGHLGAVTGFIFLLTMIFILNRTGHIKHPVGYYQKQERKDFFSKYSFNCSAGKTNSKSRFFYAVMIFSTFLPGIIAFLYLYLTGSDDVAIPVIIGTILMFILFYGNLSLLMKKNDEKIRVFFEYVNRQFTDTFLELKNYGARNSLSSNFFSLSLEGRYKGRNVFLGNSTSAYSTGGHIKVNSDTRVSIEINSTVNVTIRKNYFENKNQDFRSAPPVEYFGDSGRLTFNSKKLIGQYDRPLHLQINNGLLTYEAKDFDIIPFYTMEGVILFFDFLTDLANEIENSPYV
jgi:hypothetical protein